jgi:hypothetical protein
MKTIVLASALVASLFASSAIAGTAPAAADLAAIGSGPAGPSKGKVCGAQWKAEKVALSAKGYTWPTYWHACSLAMKTGAAATSAK